LSENRSHANKTQFRTTAAATLTLSFARISRTRAAQRTVLNDASQLSSTQVAKHVTIANRELSMM
jgi:hypothetical protein